MLLRSPAVRSRWRGISTRAHSVHDAFAMARPEVSSLAFVAAPLATHVALGASRLANWSLDFVTPGAPGPMTIALPAVHHVEGLGPARDVLPPLLRGSLGETLIAMMRARTSEEAIAIGRTVAKDPALLAEHGSGLDRALGLAMGAEPFRERWGDDAIVDWLRARQLDRLGTDLAAKPRWLGILSWLERHSEYWHALAPEGLEFMQALSPLTTAAAFGCLEVASASIARAKGGRAALQSVIAALKGHRLAPEWGAQIRRLLLRGALEGAFVPGSLKGIVPKPRAKRTESAEAWQALLLARRALIEHGEVIGAAQLTAALVAMDVRHALARALGRTGPRARIPGWGSRALNDKEVEALRAAVNRPGIRWKRRDTGDVQPWPTGWGGPDSAAIEAWLKRRLDLDSWGVREVFLHDGLAVAAVLAFSGHAANAMAVLGATRTPPSLAQARSALAREIHRGGQAVIPTLDRPWSKEADDVYRQLRTLPDPGLAIDAPYWLLGDQRSDLQHTLQTSGRLKEFRELRLLLDRPDVAAKLSPFWLLREDANTEEGLIGLVYRIGRQLEPPARDECLRFLRSRL